MTEFREFLIVLVLLMLLALLARAFAQPPVGTPPNGPYSAWFKAQLQDNGSPCCGDEAGYGGDGHFVDVRREGDQYLVKVGEDWVIFPRAVDPDLENPTGRNVAWWRGEYPNLTWYCLRLSGGI